MAAKVVKRRGEQIRVRMTPEMLARAKKVSKATGIPQLHLYTVSLAIGMRLLENALTKPAISGGISFPALVAALNVGDEVVKQGGVHKPA